MDEQRFALTDSDLDDVSAGAPNLGWYTYCNNGQRPEGLYVGGCTSPFWAAVLRGIDAAMR